jgi:hypothetical protein
MDWASSFIFRGKFNKTSKLSHQNPSSVTVGFAFRVVSAVQNLPKVPNHSVNFYSKGFLLAVIYFIN